MQTTANVLMIRPTNFTFNAETAVNNAFQVEGKDEDAQKLAVLEFENFVNLLVNEGVNVTVVNDSPLPFTPDSIFPNNWISLHNDGTVCLYPMYAVNRRHERKPAVIEKLAENFHINEKIDLSGFENQNSFLEGTGSMVLDRDNNIAYACLSPRTDIKVLETFCSLMKYRPVVFHATDSLGRAIYHTNVMMCVGEQFVVIALDSIIDADEKEHVKQVIRETGKDLIEITMEQMNAFAGNMLLLHNNKDEKLLVMSTRAYESLTVEQVSKINSFCRIVYSPLHTIETNGGGSARCMIAENHLPPRSSSINTSASSKEIGS